MLDRIKAKIHQQKTQMYCLESLKMNNSLQERNNKVNPLICDIYKINPTATILKVLTEFH